MAESQILNPMAVLSEAALAPDRSNYHAVVLTRWHGDCRCRCCDFTDATIEIARPQENIPQRKDSIVLSIHKDLLTIEPLASQSENFRFFRYNFPKESLHLSKAEYDIVAHELDTLKAEIEHGVDQFTSLLIAERISVLLTMFQRYLHRQFILCDDECRKAVEKVTLSVGRIYESGKIGGCGLPNVEACAKDVGMSEAYFLDILQYVKGQTFKEFANLIQLRTAKQMIADSHLSIPQVAHRLGFPTASCFSQFFKRVSGVMPDEYRLTRS